MAIGRIYVLTSPSQPGFVKVGKTARSTEERACELDDTSLALPLQPAYEVVTHNFHQVETAAHANLRDRRARNSREWFQCDAATAIVALKQAVTDTLGASMVGEIDYIGAKAEAEKRELEAAADKANLEAIAEQEAQRRAAALLEKLLAQANSATAHVEMSCVKCGAEFHVTVTRYETVASCPSCYSASRLPTYFNR